ncbi:hypothetical protein [Actinomycetospora termitidis]|uniref:Ribbon-helix-helix protein CopG domain-containing protein n=1 Tax=Actinomycetospora termitidis TaxID=3053470 RepID=A0ABT7MFW8_9PSEU|nr:hypothetical protein [Actinomycetospora sp. Odt1-22]MDL5158777.1 hypothetical protein [Actinomycetospora sp. Odt1-22]
MPSPDPRATPPGQGGTPRRQPPPAGERRRPEPSSMLTPSPGSLMPVGDGGPRGRRQHHRAPGAARQELVYLSGRVPRALRDELHIRAIEEGRPVVDLLRDAIRGYLDQGGAAR